MEQEGRLGFKLNSIPADSTAFNALGCFVYFAGGGSVLPSLAINEVKRANFSSYSAPHLLPPCLLQGILNNSNQHSA